MSDAEDQFHHATVCVVIPITERNREWLTQLHMQLTAFRLATDCEPHREALREMLPNNADEVCCLRDDGDNDVPFVVSIDDDHAYFLDDTRRVHLLSLMAVLQEYLLAHPGVGDIAFPWKSSLQRVSPESCRAGICLVTRFVTREITTESLIEDWCLERQLEATSNLRSEGPDTFYTPGTVMSDDDEGGDSGDEDDGDAEDE